MVTGQRLKKYLDKWCCTYSSAWVALHKEPHPTLVLGCHRPGLAVEIQHRNLNCNLTTQTIQTNLQLLQKICFKI